MNQTLRPAQDMPNIYLYRDPVDFRKSYRGLSAIVEQELGHNPFDGGLYVFTNRAHNKIKCLFWENNGFILSKNQRNYGKICAMQTPKKNTLHHRKKPSVREI